jgi:uncharacterized protein (DUF2147 family)
MKRTACVLGLAVLWAVAAAAQVQNPDALVGTWLNGDKTAHIEIHKQADGKYFGKITWLKEPTYPANDAKGMAGKDKVDRENPDPARRKEPLLGLIILRNFSYSGGNLWENGRIYDPKNGKDYKCKMTLTSPNALDVRGFVGFSFIGRTENWMRVKGTP